MPLGKASRETERLTDIGIFQIRKIGEKFFDGSTRGKSLDDHSNRDPHTPDAGLPVIMAGLIVMRSNCCIRSG